MGWFWSDIPAPPASAPAAPHPNTPAGTPPPGCPMHKKTIDALNPAAAATNASSTKATPPSSCPVSHDQAPAQKQQSAFSRLNPLNYMFPDLSNAPAPNQTVALPTEREHSSIPRGGGEGNWEYPSPQQMYHALLRKGYTDTDPTAVEAMVACHNFLNEGAWAEIVDWERRFSKGLIRGWQISRQGEERAPQILRRLEREEGAEPVVPSLVRFQGRPKDMTPKAAFFQVMGWLYPSKFETEPPFDRHDWYVQRDFNGQKKEVRYVIDYYSGPPEPTGEPVFYLDVRPAATPTGAAERLIRWGSDVWWRAAGLEAREQQQGKTQ
ncbi:hypothetical protein PpBr36_05092 [Pyricularia pennisetigena]|uniref:hypothetical protein n=1 Tax=Pyricularia pennisetigena TaxID=1578925 RepID=UPI00114F0D5D|nr:hypothetical protein PpBr36_05092 [Pyricularia pennisetigena]TLS27101.1 hypothetical protein PpBr36_05092 [Pyricularia pennisetigena]